MPHILLILNEKLKRKKSYSDGLFTVSYRDAKANSSHVTHATDIVILTEQVYELTLAPYVRTAQLTVQKRLSGLSM